MTNRWLKNFLGKHDSNSPSLSRTDGNPNPSEPILVSPQRRDAVVISPARPTPIKPAERPYWDERGWKIVIGARETRYIGNYYVLNNSSGQTDVFSGIIVFSRSRANPFILNPPDKIRLHSKWPCFRQIIDGWFRIEWFRPASHPDEAILYVESILHEVINGNNRNS